MNKRPGEAVKPWLLLLSLFLLLASAVAWGCSKAKTVEPEKEEAPEEAEEVGGETVTLTLYFRKATADRIWLAPEERKVEDVADPYRAAMEELIAGPSPGSGLDPVLPSTVRVLGVEEQDGVLTVDVSREILTDASQVGVSATTEGLALTAIADTMTEFAGVEKVKLLVEGMQSGEVGGRHVEDFWGHTGLPEYLERNEGVIYPGPGQGETGQAWQGGITFGTSPQRIEGAADGLKVASVRFYDHGSYFRAVFDIVRMDGNEAAACPATTAEWVPAAGGVKVSVSGILEVSNQAKGDLDTGDDLAQRISFMGIDGGRAEYMIATSRQAPFFLHYMSGPMRVIVDLEKAPGAQPDV